MYKKVETKLDFVNNEKQILDFWKKNNIIEKGLHLNENQGKVFSFYEGPPTANGMPHMGHPLTRAIKDVFPRFKSMKGFFVPRKAGWDTHGLPVEVEVEKNLGLNGKQDIEKFGVEKFIALCKESVWKYKGLWEKITDRLGYWIDMSDPYITYDNKYIESVFWALKEMDKKGLVYLGHKIIPYCPRCGTSLSKMEVENGDNYKILKENSVFVKFRSLQEDDTFFLVWTTTPWTLPSNVALCMNPNEIYAKISFEGHFYIMLKKLIPSLFEDGTYKVVYEKTGKEFEFCKYEPLFDFVASEIKNAYFVTVDDYVTTEDGTGIVHIAPAFGEDDYQVGKNYGLDFIQLVDESGNMSDKTRYSGLFVKKADKFIIDDLQKANKLFKILPFEHSYPHCWRCGSPLLYYAKNTWFIKTTAIKDVLVKNNASVNWLPDTIKQGRMGNFLENNIDWGISRTRYWGTPLPFWICENGHKHVVGSIDELRKLSGVDFELDLHKPTLDKITFPCPVCGKIMSRTPEVMDCWFDSGSMPFAQYHYPFENKELFEKTFPADFIAEGIDQTRGWFYTLQAVNSAVFGKSPYKTCEAIGLVNDKFGVKMSKHLGNGIDPWAILDKEGADGLRWYFFYSCSPGQGLSFNEDNLIELQRKFMGTLWNVYAFYILYAEIDNFDPTVISLDNCKLSLLDKWLLSKYNSLIFDVDSSLEKYDLQNATRLITSFVDDLSNWYVRRSRERFWQNGMADDKNAAFRTLYEVLSSLSKLIAPFVPFISETIYQNLVKSVDKNAPESVHFCSYPVANFNLIDKKLNRGMQKVLDIVMLGRACRSSSLIKNRQPLSKVIICSTEKLDLDDQLKDLIKDELNVENLQFSHDANEYVNFELKPQLKTLGPKYGKRLGEIRDFFASCNSNDIVSQLRSGKQVSFSDFIISENDVLISVKNKEGFVSESNGNITVVLDVNLTDELKEKGLIRDFISLVQQTRKDIGLEVTDHIKISINGDEYLKHVLMHYSSEIKSGTLCDSLEYGDGKFDFITDNYAVKFDITKV